MSHNRTQHTTAATGTGYRYHIISATEGPHLTHTHRRAPPHRQHSSRAILQRQSAARARAATSSTDTAAIAPPQPPQQPVDPHSSDTQTLCSALARCIASASSPRLHCHISARPPRPLSFPSPLPLLPPRVCVSEWSGCGRRCVSVLRLRSPQPLSRLCPSVSSRLRELSGCRPLVVAVVSSLPQ